MKDTTIIIKTFERPHTVQRLVDSIRVYYPDVRILVGDDSREPQEVAGAELLALPYDVGLSAGRNRLVDAVRTPYTMLLDDDFIFTEQTRIELLRVAIDAGFDIASGRVGGGEYHGMLLRRGPTLHYLFKQKRRVHNGLPVYDMTWNFFLARTEALRTVRWDEALKLAEHSDFFLRAMEVPLLVTHVDAVDVDHVQDKLPDYNTYRNRGMYYAIRFFEKHGLAKSVGFWGKEKTLAQYIANYNGRKDKLAPH
jgi:glycosyltransferase involved in cell wall biosynthesis